MDENNCSDTGKIPLRTDHPLLHLAGEPIKSNTGRLLVVNRLRSESIPVILKRLSSKSRMEISSNQIKNNNDDEITACPVDQCVDQCYTSCNLFFIALSPGAISGAKENLLLI
jgi:hypothetical protein